jgi:tRNA A-37 threonylcarbamoyl transferase component Bud32
MSDPNLYGGWSNPQDLVGTVLADRYKVMQMLGDGGMGSVFLGEHTTLRKRVAIKVLHHELCRDQTQVDRFLQEARAASMIGHENIVDIVDFGPVPGGSVFFAMEYLEGEDLADLVRREGRLSWARARELMLQVVRALAAAHDKGIIHRDLKPANCFLVKRSDGRDFVKLLDFGIAKVTDPESGDRGGLTRTGAVFGTAKYMAPEQACGEIADQRTDIYAAAICLYEFLTGTVPYDGDNFMRVLSRHLTEPLTLPSTMAPDANISPAVEAIIVKALSKKREDRYQSMREFEEALRAVGPDGNLAGGLYEGPPLAAPVMDGPGGTMWLGQQAGANHGPASQPPEGRGGTLLLDPNDPAAAEAIFGTVKLPQNWEAGQPSRPGSQPPATYMMDAPAGANVPVGAPAHGSPVTRHPARTPAAPGSRPPSSDVAASVPPGNADYTMFATEKRSPGRFVALLAVGAIAAVALGGVFAWLLVADDDDPPKEPIAATDPPKPEPKPSDDNRPPPDPPEPEPVPEIPQNPPPDDPPPEDPPPDDPPPEDPTGKEPANDTPRKDPKQRHTTPRNKEQPKVKASLEPADLTRGFQRAQSAASACQGWIPGMSIKVQATINASGSVIDASALTNTGLPVAKCVANAVKGNARFVKTTTALTVKQWTYKK